MVAKTLDFRLSESLKMRSPGLLLFQITSGKLGSFARTFFHIHLT